MNLFEHIRVDTYYTRSINIERDNNAQSVLDTYIPTTRSLQTLERIATTFTKEEIPRAWALVGPYGSGKSAFGVFCAHLLSTAGSPTNKAAVKKLRTADRDLATKFKKHLGKEGSYCQVLVTGGPEPFGTAILRRLAIAAEEYWQTKRGKKPTVVRKLHKAVQEKNVTPNNILALVEELQNAVAASGGRGLLIGIDELGKFLEYEARHYGQNEIFLLQMLAEHSQSKNKAQLHLIVFLHQSFEQYAKGLGEALRNEWSKIQGRFETIPFLESTEQTLHIVSAAFQTDLDKSAAAQVRQRTETKVKVLNQAGLLPQRLAYPEALDLFSSCYPLHPLSALLLPPLCQKVAQNERTLFSYLGSFEPNGFLDSLSHLEDVREWILPHSLYDYFVQNQPMAVIDQLAMRRWAEIETAVERLGDAPEKEVNLVKTIGLLNLIGAQGNFRASKKLLNTCTSDGKSAASTLKILEEKSIIQFRRYSGEYRVWQGSDFDIDEAIQDSANELGQFGLAETLTQRQALNPIVARRHSIETGHLRYFELKFQDQTTVNNLGQNNEPPQLALVKKNPERHNPSIVLYLAEGEEDLREFRAICIDISTTDDVIGICPLGPQLRQAIIDVLSLERIHLQNQELNRDPIALRELGDRLTAAQLVEEELTSSILEHPENHDWYWKGIPLTANNQPIDSKRSFQSALSAVMDSVYSQTPIIRNELLNRDRPSGQAHGARNKLLEALIKHTEAENLNIEKSPPEKAVYDAVIKAPGFHRKTKTGWSINDPRNEQYNFEPFWSEIDQFFSGSETSPRSFEELTEILVAPPFGLKRGLLPLIYVLALLRHQHDLALYENKVYSPYLTVEVVERFVRRPHDFTVQRFQIKGLRRSIFQEYSTALFEDQTQAKDIISIARPLARFITDLPGYTQQTKRLSTQAQEVRDAFKLAKSPQKLLFDLIPKACGFKGKSSSKQYAGFSEVLVNVLRELKYALPSLRTEIQDLFKSAFRLEKNTSLKQIRSILTGRFNGLQDYTIDTEGLRAFLNRTLNSKDDDDAWFANLLLFLGHKPVDKWTDIDRDAAELRLAEFSRRINDLERLRVHYDGVDAAGGNLEVLLLKTGSRESGEKDEIVVLNEEMKNALKSVIDSIKKTIEEIPDEGLRLAAVATIADQFLAEYRDKKEITPLLKPQGVTNE